MREIDRLGGQLKFGEIEVGVFIERCLEIICRRVNCSRSGLWLFSHSQSGLRALRCVGMFDRRDDRMIPAATDWVDLDEAYFAELASRGKVVAADVQTHPVTARHFEAYFRQQDIRSFLAVACSLNGRVCGAFTCAEIGSVMNWSGGQVRILSMLGARATVSLADQFSGAGHIVIRADADKREEDGPELGCL